ncbi:MAG TPA: glycosyltransferase [Thermoleophilaceae bacterium]|nr:glycosyltransferase [Thermoleophilaceae bacterium]
MPTAGHVLRSYLPRSATFVHTTLRHQRGYRPVVLAGRLENAAEFPVEHLVELAAPGSPLPTRLARRAAALAARAPGVWEHRIRVEAERHGCALLHAHFGYGAPPALHAAERDGIPLLTTFYGNDLALPAREPAWREAYDRLFEVGRLFLCEGPAMREHLVSIGAPATQVRVVRIGLDLEQFPFAPRPRGERIVFGQACRFVEKKGVDLTLRAFAAALPRLGDAELLLVGDGPEAERLRALASDLGLGDAVRFHGMVSHAEYRDLLASIDVCVQPSRTAADGDTEGGAPTVLLEMQAAGVPVIATSHADIPAVVARPDELAAEEDVESLAAAMEREAALGEPERAERAEAGRALVEQAHDARVVAAGLERLYDEAAP